MSRPEGEFERRVGEREVPVEESGTPLVSPLLARVSLVAAAGTTVAFLLLLRSEVVLTGVVWAGLMLSIGLLAFILLDWLRRSRRRSRVEPPTPRELVTDFENSEGGPCSPLRSARILVMPGDPEFSGWEVRDTWIQKALGRDLKGRLPARLVPSLRELGYGFARIERTVFYTCQDQICEPPGWANRGPPYACDQTQVREVQVHGGPGGQELQGWSADAIRQSVHSDYFY
jgi:hypothetical protein